MTMFNWKRQGINSIRTYGNTKNIIIRTEKVPQAVGISSNSLWKFLSYFSCSYRIFKLKKQLFHLLMLQNKTNMRMMNLS